jgi:hypothetical protein
MYTLFMRNKVSSIIAFISILLYVAALGIGAIRILAGLQDRRAVAVREFYDLADVASSAGTLGFMEEAFKDAVRDAVNASKTLQAVIVTGPFGAEFTYDRDESGLIAWEGDTPRFQRHFGVSRNPHFSPLRVAGMRNATIQAVSGVLDYPAFSRILLQSLFMVLAAALLSAITLLIYHVRGKKAALVSDKMQEIFPPHEGQTAAMDPAQTAKNVGDTVIQEKLDSELGVCALVDKDLTLLLMKTIPAPGFSDDDSVNQKLMEQAEHYFDRIGFVYERGAGGFALIQSGDGLEESFSRARLFRDLIVKDIPKLFPSLSDLRVGLSSRNNRLVRADQLFLETSRALDKTGPDSPLVAFKSDPEKYKAFMQSRKKPAGA